MYSYTPGETAVSQSEYAIWQNRWQALEQAIGAIIAGLPAATEAPKSGGAADWQVTLHSALQCLQAFGKKQFDFFLNGFAQDGWLVESPRYHAEHALRGTLDQVAFDLSVLQRARNQRLESAAHQPAAPYRSGAETLALADRLAYQALKPAIDAGLLQETTVITYFQKSAHVRVVPYAHIALVGIPYTCIDLENNARDFLAIPHEVGHYVYWHGKLRGVRLNSWLRSVMPAEPLWRASWLEEIFADVYGCLVAGPIIALDFQELLYDNADLYYDDGEHPVAAIRPFLYSDTLRALHKNNQQPLFPTAPDRLDEHWQTLRAVRENRKTFKPKRGRTPDEVQLDETRAPLRETTSMILAILQDALPRQAADTWSDDTLDPQNQPYNLFKTAVTDRLTQQKPPRLVARRTDAAQEGAATKPGDILWTPGDSPMEWFELFNSAQRNGLKLLPETWNTLLEGGGWAAGGPDNEGSPKGV